MKKDKITKKENTYSEGQVAVILEDIRSQQKAIFEGQEFIKSKIESLETNQARMWEKISETDLRTIRIERDVSEIKVDIKGHSERLAHLEAVK